MIRPKRLRAGARIALVAPAGPLSPEAIDRACERVRSLGWEPLLGPHARCRTGYLAGSDDDRLADLVAALAPGASDAIWCLRGGYGTMRIAARINFGALRLDPRPLIGFSDNTVLHLAASRAGITSFHGPHAGVADFPDFTRDQMLGIVERVEAVGALPMPAADSPGPATITPGVAEGRLMGGNLSLLAATVGTRYQLAAEGAILFVEEVGEPVYKLDRLLSQLRLSGVLRGVAGIAVGAISECPDEGRGLPAPAEIVRDRLADLGVPLACGFPFGHVPLSWTLPVGVRARLDATRGTIELLEAAVAE